MSSENSFLARWSRRKQAVKAAEFSPPEAPADEPARDAEAQSADVPLRVPEEAGTAETPLPSIDDLTADSDISAFLRKGVPEALKQAALRKAWALDPAIRDHIGPADYAWDYNDPGSIPGFGGSIKSAALDKLASLTGSEPPSPPPDPLAANTPASGSVRLSSAAQPAAEAADRPSMSDPAPLASPQEDSPSAEPSASEAPPDRPPPPRHGGALPR